MAINDVFLRLLTLPFIPLLFAYLEQGGNLYAEQTLEVPTPRNLGITFVFSVLYSFVAALVATSLHVNLAIMMVNYGFGFSIVSLLLDLQWNRLPNFTRRRLAANPNLRIPLAIALVGFIASAYFVIFT